MLNELQKNELAAPLQSSHVKTRSQSGRSLSYIEGWWAISEANRIFGFDGWTRETVELKCVAEHERTVGQRGDKGWGVTYIAKVRVIVGSDIVREGCGTGHGIDRDLGQAHESALKEAETDAMKRALMTFGNPFGLALYDKEQANVANEESPAPAKTPVATPQTAEAYVKVAKVAINAAKSKQDLTAWWAAEQPNRAKYKLKQDDGPGLDLIMAYHDKKDAFDNAGTAPDLLMAG